jgi:hypothetical protein
MPRHDHNPNLHIDKGMEFIPTNSVKHYGGLGYVLFIGPIRIHIVKDSTKDGAISTTTLGNFLHMQDSP